MTSPSENTARTCPRCGVLVGKKSVFAIHVWVENDRLSHDVVFAKDTPKNGFLMHMSADRECAGEISGYVGKLLKNLGLPVSYDISKMNIFVY